MPKSNINWSKTEYGSYEAYLKTMRKKEMFEVEFEFIMRDKIKVKALDSTNAEDIAHKALYLKYPEVPKASVEVLGVEEVDG